MAGTLGDYSVPGLPYSQSVQTGRHTERRESDDADATKNVALGGTGSRRRRSTRTESTLQEGRHDS